MKTLDFNEMESVQGGIKCSEILGVLNYLDAIGNDEQFEIVATLWFEGKIQCI